MPNSIGAGVPAATDDAESSEEKYSSSGARETKRGTGSIEVARPGVYNVRFSAGKSMKQKLERFAEVLGIDCATRHMPEIFEKALDLALEKMDPKKKLERRIKRQVARSKTRPDEAKKRDAGSRAFQAPPGAQASRLHLSRYIPSSVRERRLEHADYQCEFRGPSGVRCTARTRLEVDHIEPVGKGGSCDEENLRVYCRGHTFSLRSGSSGRRS